MISTPIYYYMNVTLSGIRGGRDNSEEGLPHCRH